MNDFQKAHMHFKRLKAGFDFSLLTPQELNEAQTLLKKHYNLTLKPLTSSTLLEKFTPENDKSLLNLLLQGKIKEETI